jgi:hypothetical protein
VRIHVKMHVSCHIYEWPNACHIFVTYILCN